MLILSMHIYHTVQCSFITPCSLLFQSHTVVEIGKHLVQLSAQSKVSYSKLLNNMSIWVLDIFKNGGSNTWQSISLLKHTHKQNQNPTLYMSFFSVSASVNCLLLCPECQWEESGSIFFGLLQPEERLILVYK